MAENDQVSNPEEHSFHKHPNKTLIALATPVLFSMIAEPLTGLVDTSFISKLGASQLSALGVGTVTLSSVFWIFNFLSVGSQTEIAQLTGKKENQRACEVAGLAIILATIFGIMITIFMIPLTEIVSKAMGAEDNILEYSIEYMHLRFLAAPAILVSLTSFGLLRGIQDMRTPMKIAILVNLINVILDPIFIFGVESLSIPAMGIGGAASATVFSQYVGASLCLIAVIRHFGKPKQVNLQDAASLIKIGGDLFLRTGLLTIFILLTTREATKIGADGGAAHQAIRQIWMFTALFLDSFAITAQSLIGYFLGANQIMVARKVARYVLGWSALTGTILCLSMLLGTNLVVSLLVPASALSLFSMAWIVASVAQPVNALAFATDGIHWGVGDFAFLRNVMFLATGTGASLLLFSPLYILDPLTTIWCITAVWIFVRAAFGILRVFPGLGKSPLRKPAHSS